MQDQRPADGTVNNKKNKKRLLPDDELLSGDLFSEEDLDYKPPKPQRKSKRKITTQLVASVDHAGLSSRNATNVILSTAHYLDVDPKDVAVSPSTIYRQRRSIRRHIRDNVKNTFCANITDAFFVLHWDGKILPKWHGVDRKIDKLAIQQIQEYRKINFSVAEAAMEIISRHLWYLSEIAIGLSFFDPRHSPNTLDEMASALNSTGDQQNLFRYKCFLKEANLKIVDLVSKNTKMFFDIIGINYEFIQSPSSCWRENENFKKIEQFAINLTVVNDPAERAIGLLKTVNNTLVMGDSEQNDLIQVIEHFHKMHPNYNKSTVLANLKK